MKTYENDKGVDLITGGAGFIGSHLTEYLVSLGRQVVVVDSLDAGKLANLPDSGMPVQFVQADVRSDEWWAQLNELNIERVFHLAANASVPRSARDPIYDVSTNVEGTLRMLRLAKNHRARFVFISSAAVYGDLQYSPTDEEHPTRPISHYGTSKLAGEHYVNLYRQEFDLDTRIIRYFNCYGPKQPRYVVFDYLKKADLPSDTFEVLGDGKQVRTQLFVTDAVRATVLVAELGDCDPYNVGSEKAFTVLELAQKILNVTGKSHKSIVTTGESWPGDIAVLKPDITRLKSLGFKQEYSLETGLEEVLRWWQTKSVSES